MINQISIEKVKETIYALSALNLRLNDPKLPGPLGLSDSPALDALAQEAFASVCIALGKDMADETSVELNGNYRAALEEIVTDRILARLTHREPRADLLTRLKARMRPVPKKE